MKKTPIARHDIAPGICSRAVNNQCHMRVTRALDKGLPHLAAIALNEAIVGRIVASTGRCECCRIPMSTLTVTGYVGKASGAGKGRAPRTALSIHKVIPALGYVADNIRVICRTCNESIGNAATREECVARLRAVAWQAGELPG